MKSEKYAPINAEFEAFAQAKRKWDPHWYELPRGSDSPKSIRELSSKLERLHEYDVVYANLSGIVHSTCFGSHVTIGDGMATFEPIRNLKQIDFTIRLGAASVLGIFRAITQQYRPAELENLRHKYVNDWRKAFLEIPKPNYPTVQTFERPV